MRFIRRIASPLTSLVTAIGLVLTGTPPELIDTAAASAGQFMENMLSLGKRTAESPQTVGLLAQRAQALDEFGRSVTLAWHAAGTLMRVRPKLLGYVHTVALLVRAQRQFEDSMAKTAAALSSILLYTSPDTQESALALFSELGARLGQLARSGKQGSPKVSRHLDDASVALGQKVVAWRASARRELAANTGSS